MNLTLIARELLIYNSQLVLENAHPILYMWTTSIRKWPSISEVSTFYIGETMLPS
jgi:hypothetical protein